MDEVAQPVNPLSQIEQQVSQGSTGLPPVGPYIVSEESVQPSNKKNIIINVLLAMGIVGVVVICIVLVNALKPRVTKVAQVSPTPAEQPEVAMGAKYANPFEKTTQYANPFAQQVNPFDAYDGVTK